MNIHPPNAHIKLIPQFIKVKDADLFLKHLQNNISWEQHFIKIFGRRIRSPRLSAWYGDIEANYSYSGQQLKPIPWTPQLANLRETINDQFDLNLNSVLLNYYRTGLDNMGWHSDDETSLGKNPTIASLSLGSKRRFVMKHKYHKDLPKLEYNLGNGDLIVMSGPTQHFWKHQIPKTLKPTKPRINLTFRKILIQHN